MAYITGGKDLLTLILYSKDTHCHPDRLVKLLDY